MEAELHVEEKDAELTGTGRLGECEREGMHTHVLITYIKIVVVCPPVCPLREVSGNELTPRNGRLYL